MGVDGRGRVQFANKIDYICYSTIFLLKKDFDQSLFLSYFGLFSVYDFISALVILNISNYTFISPCSAWTQIFIPTWSLSNKLHAVARQMVEL